MSQQISSNAVVTPKSYVATGSPTTSEIASGSMRKTYTETDEFYKNFAWEKNRYWAQHPMNLIENYIYLYHLDQYIILPDFPEEVNDQQPPKWTPSSPLLSTAPIQSYSGNEARRIQCKLLLHRDMMNDINATNYSSVVPAINWSSDEDYVDRAVKQLLAAQMPVYNQAQMAVRPPVVAMRLGNEIYIKGVLANCGITYRKPILRNGKYAQIDVSIEVIETEPYDAEMVLDYGSFRCARTLNRNTYAYKYGDSAGASKDYVHRVKE